MQIELQEKRSGKKRKITLSEADTDLLALCRSGEGIVRELQETLPVLEYPTQPLHVSLATLLYAEAINLCQKADLPISSVRVKMLLGGSTVFWLHNEATVLTWDGTSWQATVQRIPLRQQIMEDRYIGEAWLELDSRPEKKLKAKKQRGQEKYMVEVGSVCGYSVSPPTGEIFDPWAPPPKPKFDLFAKYNKAKKKPKKQTSNVISNLPQMFTASSLLFGLVKLLGVNGAVSKIIASSSPIEGIGDLLDRLAAAYSPSDISGLEW